MHESLPPEVTVQDIADLGPVIVLAELKQDAFANHFVLAFQCNCPAHTIALCVRLQVSASMSEIG